MFNKTKTQKITTANQSKENSSRSQWERKVNESKLSKARENVSDEVVVSFSFVSDE